MIKLTKESYKDWTPKKKKITIDGDSEIYTGYARLLGNKMFAIVPTIYDNGELGYDVYCGNRKVETGFELPYDAIDWAEEFYVDSDIHESKKLNITIKEDFGNRLQFTISSKTPKTYGESRADSIKDLLIDFWKSFVYSPDSDILDDLGTPVTGITDCKCEVDYAFAYLYPRIDLTDVNKQDLSHTAFELNKTNIAKDYKAHFGYGWSKIAKSFYIQIQLPENLQIKSNYSWGPIGTESVKRMKESLSIEDKKFKEAVRFCDDTVEDLADELWRRYVSLEDAIDSIKLYYQSSKGRRSLLSDIALLLNTGDLENVIEDVYFNKDREMDSISNHFGRV